jgi:hypothetical protein
MCLITLKYLLRLKSALLATGSLALMLILGACTLHIGAPPPGVLSPDDVMATAVEGTMQAAPGERPESEVATSVASTMQIQHGSAQPPGLQIVDHTQSPDVPPSNGQSTPPPPTTAANPQPDSTNPTQPQQPGSTVPSATSVIQSVVTNTPGLPSFITNTPGLPSFITDTPGLPPMITNTPGMLYMVTDTPSMFSLTTNTPIGIHQLPAETATVQASPACMLPDAPSNLVFIKWLGSSLDRPLVNFRWQDNAEHETAFRIYYLNDGGYEGYGRDSEAGSRYVPPLGLCNRQMSFHVTAINECGESAPSNTVSVTGQCAPGQPGLLLNNSEYSQYSNSVIHTFWIYAPATKQDEVLKYRVYLSGQSGADREILPPDNSFIITRECGIPAVDIHVTAVNFGGESQTSAILTMDDQLCPTWQPSGSGL